MTTSPGSRSESRSSQSARDLAELAGGLAHELRNPLSTIMVHLGLLAEDLGDESTDAQDVRRRGLIRVKALQKEAARLQSLFEDFLNVVGPYELKRDKVDLCALAAELVDFFEPVVRGSSVSIELSEGDQPIVAFVDEKLVRQALLNLVINARDAMPEGGKIRVSVTEHDDGVRVAVRDDGVGIPEANLERIQRPFFTSKGRASGLGLSITKRIVDEHGGSLEIESKLGHGSTFAMRLPRSR